MAIWIAHAGFFPVLCILTRKNSGKHSPPGRQRSRVAAASCPLMSFLSLFSPCSLSPACSAWLCQQVLDDPTEDHLYMGKTRALAFCHPRSGSCVCQSPGVLSRQPRPLASPTQDSFFFPALARPHSEPTEGCTPDSKQEVEGSSCWDFLYLDVLVIHLPICIEHLLCAGSFSRP